MDILTHSIWWYFLQKNFYKSTSKKILSIFIISSIFPDIDIIWSYNNYDFHRVLTHSLLTIPFLSIFLSIIFYYLFKKEIKFFKIFLICISWMLLHIFLDIILIWWVQLLWPLSNNYYSLNLYTYVFEPFFFPIYIIFLASILKITKPLNTKIIKIIWIYALLVFWIKFWIHIYIDTISNTNNNTVVWIINKSSDFFIQRNYISIHIDKDTIKGKIIDLYTWKMIKNFEKKLYINNDWYCSNLHNGFLYIENWIVWDIRYTLNPKDSENCFYWLKISN